MQSLPLEFLGLITAITIPDIQVMSLSNQEKDQDKDNSRLSQSQTLPIGLADTEEREEQEKEKENKVPEAPRKEVNHSQETARTLLITLMRLEKHFHPESMILTMQMMLSQTFCELHKMR